MTSIAEKWTVEQFEDEARRMDPNINGRQLKAAVVLLAAVQEGTSPERLTDFTAYPRKTVFEFVKRLRMNGVFAEWGRVAGRDWFGKNGGAAFWLDVCVALGFMTRVPPAPRQVARERSAGRRRV